MQEQKFTAPTLAEAHCKADDWLAGHPKVHQLTRKELTVGFGGMLPPLDVSEYSVTVYYESDG
jgi:hypothetical protein